MIEFDYPLELGQVLISSLSTGVLLISMIIFSYLYKLSSRKTNLSMLLLGIFALIFVASELGVMLAGGWSYSWETGVQFHRAEQLGGLFFIYAVPYYLYQNLKLTPSWKNINRMLTYAGFVFSISVALAAFIQSDLFISITEHKDTWMTFAWDHGRGKEGKLYELRDMILGFIMVYGFVCFLYDLIVNREIKYNMFGFLGLIVASLGAMDDIMFVYTGHHFGFFPEVHYSRFSVGITVFIAMSMAGIIKKFVDRSMEVEKIYTEINSTYKALYNSEERFRQLAENINEAFIIFDNINKMVLYVSPAFENIWGRPSDILYENPHSWLENLHPDEKKIIEDKYKNEIARNKVEYEYRIICPDNTVKWVSDQFVPIKDKNDQVYRIARILKDITAKKKSEDDITYLAYHDLVTNIPNRRAFFEKLEDMLSQANRNKQGVNIAMFYMDLDRFKLVNDTIGHEGGDYILGKISKRIKQAIRETDYLYRIGGDEFAIILNNITQDIDAGLVARKILDSMAKPLKNNGSDIYLSISIGISVYPKDGVDVTRLVKNSEVALQSAKRGRNSYKFYNEEMNRKSTEKIEIENYLRFAIEKKEFELYYQPLVSSSGKIIGMEALIRWHHPSLGFMPPDKFIPVAESTGQIMHIGDWTLREACRHIKACHEAGYGDLKVAVNLSAVQFRDENLVSKVETVLYEAGLTPFALELEITESSVMENPEDAIDKINLLFSKGISFSIDDFGTGYSSLSYLKKFKIHNLKVDRSFIKDIIEDQNNTQITRAIIDMAHNLRLKVVAEGVETTEQRDFLKEIDCDIMQGYLFSKPVPAEEFMKILRVGVGKI